MPAQLGNLDSIAASGIVFPFDLTSLASEGLLSTGQPPPVDETEGCPPQLSVGTADYISPAGVLGNLDFLGADLLLLELTGYYPQLAIVDHYDPQLELLETSGPPVLESVAISQIGLVPPQLSVTFSQLTTGIITPAGEASWSLDVTTSENNPALVDISMDAELLMQDDSNDVIPGVVISGPVCSIE